MNVGKKLFTNVVVLLCLLLICTVVITGCKKKSEPVPPAEVKAPATAAATMEQTVCPVMGAPVNKDIFTEYNGKKVYFCCPGCKGKFEAEPEKYLSKLPQFNK